MKQSTKKSLWADTGNRGKVLLWVLSLLFLSSIVHAVPNKFDYLTYDYTDCGIVTCASYYTLHNPTGGTQTIDENTLGIDQIMQDKGYLTNIRIEYYNGTAWNEHQEALIKDSEIDNGKTEIATPEDIAADPSSIKNIEKADPDLQKGSIIAAMKELLNPQAASIEETVQPTMAAITTLQESPGKDIKIRIIGNIAPIYKDGGVSYSFDHIPTFQGYSYPEYAVWNQSFQKCINVNITYTLLQATAINETFPQRLLLNSSIINTSLVNSDWSDLRISNGTCTNVNSDYIYNFVYRNTTHAEIIFYTAANDIRNATALTIAVYYNNSAATHTDAASSTITFGQGNMQRVRIFTNDLTNDTNNISQTAFNESSGAFGTLVSMNIAQIVSNGAFYWAKEKQLNSTNGGLYTYVGTTRPDQNVNGFSTMFKFRLYNASATLNKQYLFHIGNASAVPQANGARLGIAEMWLQGTLASGTSTNNFTTDQTSQSYVADTSATDMRGVQFFTVRAVNMTDVIKQGSSDATTALLLDASKNLIATATFSGNDATFNNALAANTFYFVVLNKGGGTRVIYRDVTPGFNVIGANMNFTAGIYSHTTDGTGTVDTGVIYDIVSITTNNVTVTAAASTVSQTLNVSVYYYNATYSKTFSLGNLISNTSYGIGLTATLTDGTNERTQVFFNGTKLDETYNAIVANPAGGYLFSQDTSGYCTSGANGGSTCFKNYLWGAHGIINQSGDIQSVNETLNGTIDEIIIADSAVGNTTKFGLPMMEAWTYSAPQITFGGAIGTPNPVSALVCAGINKTWINCNMTAAPLTQSLVNESVRRPSLDPYGTSTVTNINRGMMFKMNRDAIGVNVWFVAGNMTRALLYRGMSTNYINGTDTILLANVSVGNLRGNFSNLSLARAAPNGTEYIYTLLADANGGYYSISQSSSGIAYPLNDTWVNYISGFVNPISDSRAWGIENITIDANFVQVTLNGSKYGIMGTNESSFNFTTLSPNTSYLLGFQVFNNLNNSDFLNAVNDPQFLASTITSNVSKTVANNPPNITNFTPSNLSPTFDENTTQNFTVNATDDDGAGNIVYQWFKDNVFQVFGQIYTWIIGYNDQGAHNITVIVNDSYGASASVTWNVTVNDTFPAPMSPVFNPSGGSYRTYIPISCRSPNSYSSVDDYTITVSVNGATPLNLSEHNKYAAIDFDITKYNYYTNFTFNCTANSFAGNVSTSSGIFTRDYVNEFYSTTTQNNFNFDSLQPYTFSLYYDASTIANNIFVQYAYADCNGDGLYDYVYNYTTINPSRIKNYYTCVFPSGEVNYEIGVYLNKTAGTSWSGSGCSADYDYSNTCLVKKTYTLKVT